MLKTLSLPRPLPYVQRVLHITAVGAHWGRRVSGEAAQQVKDRLEAARIEAADRESRETVLVFDEEQACIWRAAIPTEALMAGMDRRSRFLPDRDNSYWWTLSGCIAAGMLIMFLGFVTITNPIFAAFFSVPFGALLGAGAGHRLAPRFRPRPIWLVRRHIGTEPHPDTGELLEFEKITPLRHTYIGFDDGYSMAQDALSETLYGGGKKNGNNGNNGAGGAGGYDDEPARIPLRVIRATGVYETIQARDSKALMSSTGDKMRKFTLMGVGMIAIFFAVIVVLFAITMAGN